MRVMGAMRVEDLPKSAREIIHRITLGMPWTEDEAADLARLGLVSWGEPWSWTNAAKEMFRVYAEEAGERRDKAYRQVHFLVVSGAHRWRYIDGDAAVLMARQRAMPPFRPRRCVRVECRNGYGSMEAVVFIKAGGREEWLNGFKDGGLNAQAAAKAEASIESQRKYHAERAAKGGARG